MGQEGTENWAPLPRVFHITKDLGSMKRECETASVMSAHVRSMACEGAKICDHECTCNQEKTQDRQDETTRNYHKNCTQNQSPSTCQYVTTTDSNAVTNQRAESKGNSLAPTRLDCCHEHPYTTFHRVQSTSHQPNPHVVHLVLTWMQ